MSAEVGQDSESPKCWALIVGISNYSNASLRRGVKYAAKDAEELWKTIQLPYAGGFKEDNILKLIDEKADDDSIRDALKNFLKKPRKDDFVLIYFACHGASDPEVGKNVYFLPYNTDPTNFAKNGIEMEMIQREVERTLKAERVLIVADACHSAEIGPPGRAGGASSGRINAFMKHMKFANKGVFALTSTRENETAKEDEEHEHGVFTYYLLKGMKGAADNDPMDGIVTADELYKYVSKEVEKATRSDQHPQKFVTGNALKLPVSMPSTLTAPEHFELGKNLYFSGLLLDDECRFEAASKQLKKAIDQRLRSGEVWPEADLYDGLAQMALKNFSSAKGSFKNILKTNADVNQKALAEYYLSIIYTKEGEIDEARKICESFLENYSQHEKAPFMAEFGELLSTKATRKVYALLIGIGKYMQQGMDLRGVDNDLMLMNEYLSENLGFPVEIEILKDEKATYMNILKAIAKLQHITTEHDIVLVYFTGHAFPGDSDPYIIAHDFMRDNGGNKQVISSEEFHNLISKIPAHTTLILDTHSTKQFVKLAEKDKKYSLFSASSPTTTAVELTIEGKYHGFFTYNLVKSLKELSCSAPQKEIFEKTKSLILSGKTTEEQQKQVPLLISPNEDAAFIYSWISTQLWIELFDFSQRRNYLYVAPEYVRSLFEKVPKSIKENWPELYQSFGVAFLFNNDLGDACLALQKALKTSKIVHPELPLLLGLAQLRSNDYKKAIGTLKLLRKEPSCVSEIEETISIINKLDSGTKHALLVGIDNYENKRIPSLRGAVNDVEAMKSVLVEKYGFREENIKTLVNEGAKRDDIIRAFSTIAEIAREEPAIFYYAGYGSLSREPFTDISEPSILGCNSLFENQEGITLGELQKIVGTSPSSNLFSIIDAGWDEGFKTPWGIIGSRFYLEPLFSFARKTRSEDNQEVQRILQDPEQSEKYVKNSVAWRYKIGLLSVFPISIRSLISNKKDFRRDSISEAEFPSLDSTGEKKTYGTMTYHLVKSLGELCASKIFTYGELEKGLSSKLQWLSPYCCGFDDAGKDLLFSNIVRAEEATKRLGLVIEEILAEPFHKIVQIADNLAEKGDNSPELSLERGIALLEMDDSLTSIPQFEDAISKTARESRLFAEAQYQLGRAYYNTANMDKAIACFHDLIKGGTLSEYLAIRTNYYHGRALQRRIEHLRSEELDAARKAYQNYLHAGAPISARNEIEEIEAFLKRTEPIQTKL